MLEVVAVADKAYNQVLKNFPDFLTGSSVTVALVGHFSKSSREAYFGCSGRD